MKKPFFLLFTLLMILVAGYYAIAQKQTKKPVAKVASKKGAPVSSTADIAKGKDLISKSDCLVCHQLQVKTVGPAYSAVAEKYPATEANIAMLTQKVIKGGSGVWGPIPMSPHPTLESADVKKMVQYVLSQKAK